ncbi:hypothetical protein F0562_029386 [Nyssa sinensis]|uniref:Uncharacterized protein n=1 Tax=Nyssa sinensis TaxID=561372 RepID=A0A5J5B2P3_9ASTE|nr:hypothetical protein F0562_029386 [Nyssa sinensis]
MSVVEIATSEAEARHNLEIEATKVAAVDVQKDMILKLGRKLTFDSYNLCLKKMAKAFLEIDIEVLDYIEVFDIKSSLVGLFAEKEALAQEARYRFGHSEVVDFELVEVSVGLEPVAMAAGLERVVGVSNSNLVVAVVESVRLKLVDFELNFSWFGLVSQSAEPWYLSFDQLYLDEADV